jgi:hypothetical protein
MIKWLHRIRYYVDPEYRQRFELAYCLVNFGLRYGEELAKKSEAEWIRRGVDPETARRLATQ